MPLTSEETASLDALFGDGQVPGVGAGPQMPPIEQDQRDSDFEKLDKLFGVRGLSTEAALDIASRRNPDEHARNLDLAESTGLPVQTVERNRDEVSRRQLLDAVDLSGYDNTARFLGNADNASVAIDDLDILKSMEDAVVDRPWWEDVAHTFEGFGESLPIIAEQLGAQFQLMGVEGITPPATVQAFFPELPEEIRTPEDMARADALLEEIESGQKKLEELRPEDLTWFQGLSRQAAQSVLENLLPMGLSAATRQPYIGLAPMVATAKARAYAEAREGGKTPEEANIIGGAQAFWEGLTEYLPMKTFTELTGGLAPGETGKAVAKYFAQEIAGEQINTLLGTATDVLVGLDEELGDAFSRGDYLGMLAIQGERQAATLVITALAGSAQAGIGAGVGAAVGAIGKKGASETETVMSSLSEQQQIDQIVAGAQESKTLGRSPKHFDTFMQSLGDKEVFLTQEAAAEILEPPDYIREKLDPVGGDIAIPLNRFATDLATNADTMAVIRPHIRLSDRGLTAAELESGELAGEGMQSLLDQAQESVEVKTEADAIYEQVVSQLTATGRMSEEFARTSAEIIPAYVTTWVAKARAQGDDISVEQAYQEMFRGQGLRIVGPKVQPGAEVPDVILDQAPAPVYEPGQDFGDLMYEETVVHAETGKPMQARTRVQDMWDDTQDRRSRLSELMECLRA